MTQPIYSYRLTTEGLMKPIKNKLRNFRITEDLDQRLVLAANAVHADVSRLLRDLTFEGIELILSDTEVQNALRRRYAI